MNCRSLFHTNGMSPSCSKCLSGYVNSQNNRYRPSENVILIHEVLYMASNFGVDVFISLFRCGGSTKDY
jgi:hypothetical protein